MIFVDCDDIILPNTLGKIASELEEHPDLDILMYDMLKSKNGIDERMPYKGNHSNEVSGRDFFIQNEITYAVWLQAYRRDFLMGHKLFFQENIQFEDGDWSIEAVLQAAKVKYIPVMAYHYVINNSSTTSIKTAGNNIIDAMESVKRMDILYRKYSSDNEIRQKLYGHRIIGAKACSYRLIHVRNFKKIYHLIKRYYKNRFKHSDGIYLFILSHFALSSAITIYFCSPLLRRMLLAKQQR